MCTLIALRRPDHPWPLLIAANRDEMAGRPWAPPGRHWDDRPEVVAGIDLLAGGTWLGINDEGVVAGVLNRRDSLGRDPALRSRGELVLEALDHADATEAAAALSHIDGTAYRSFNLVIADRRDAYWLCGLGRAGDGRIALGAVPEGLSMFTSREPNDPRSPRIRRFLPAFRAARAPDPGSGDWSSWTALLARRDHAEGAGPDEAMTVVTDYGFGTLSSSLIAVPAAHGRRPIWRFSAGRPDEVPYRDVALG